MIGELDFSKRISGPEVLLVDLKSFTVDPKQYLVEPLGQTVDHVFCWWANTFGDRPNYFCGRPLTLSVGHYLHRWVNLTWSFLKNQNGRSGRP